MLITENRFYHKTKDHRYNGALCGADVHWLQLAMNDDMVCCKKCQELEGKRSIEFERLVGGQA